jgi:hypothetical protein
MSVGLETAGGAQGETGRRSCPCPPQRSLQRLWHVQANNGGEVAV